MGDAIPINEKGLYYKLKCDNCKHSYVPNINQDKYKCPECGHVIKTYKRGGYL